MLCEGVFFKQQVCLQPLWISWKTQSFPVKSRKSSVDIKWTKISVSEDVLCMDIYTSIFVHTL